MIDQIETILDPNESGEISIMMAEFKTHINMYLKVLENSAVCSLADIIAFNENNAELVRILALLLVDSSYSDHTLKLCQDEKLIPLHDL